MQGLKISFRTLRNFFFATLSLLLFSCEKVVEIDLNDANQQMIVEGLVSDEMDESFVQLSKTASFYETNDFEMVQGATVRIADSEGNSFDFLEVSPGRYQPAAGFAGVPGRTYTLSVEAEGQTISGTSTMPAAVVLDSLVPDPFDAPFGGVEGNHRLLQYFSDGAATQNFYRSVVYVDGLRQTDILVFDDQLFNGAHTELPVFQNLFESGEQVEIQLLSTTEHYYDYFLAVSSDGNGFASAAPGNPTSNLVGDADGYFSAVSSSRAMALIP